MTHSSRSRFWLLVLGSSWLFGISSSGWSQASRTVPDVGAGRHPVDAPEPRQSVDWVGIRAAHATWRHEFREDQREWVAHNPGQRWVSAFDGKAFLVTPEEAGWTWGLELHSYGFESELKELGDRAGVSAEGQGLSYHWPCGLEEWFVNDHRGLEHGFIVRERPSDASEGEPLGFTLKTLGNLRPEVAGGTRDVHFLDERGTTVVSYSGLKVWDADGTMLPAWFDPAADGTFRLLVEESGASYPITIDPIAQQATLKASNVGEDDKFGWSVAVSGNTVVIGAPGEDSGAPGVNGTPDDSVSSAGAAYVFVRNSGSWVQQAYLKASVPGSGDEFGAAVSIDGDTIVIGAPWEDGSGAAYVFTRTGGTWAQQALLKASNADGSDQFGCSVSVAESIVAVGAEHERSTGAGVNSTPNNLGLANGAAYIFRWSDGTWNQQAYLKPSNPFPGGEFGASIAASEELVVVGYPGDPSSTTGVNTVPNDDARFSGAAYVFALDPDVGWFEHSYLKASNAQKDDLFGHSVGVSSDGQTVVVGAPGEDSGTSGVNTTANELAERSGAVYVFERSRSGWDWTEQAYLKASNTGTGDRFGYSVGISCPIVEAAVDTLVVGAYREDSGTTGIDSTPDETSQASGAAYVFERRGENWSQRTYLKATNTGAEDYFGSAAGVDDGTVVVGAFGEDGSIGGVNAPTNDAAPDAGAAYVFGGFGPADLEVQSPQGSEWFEGPKPLDFGLIEPGGMSSREVVLRNRGGELLTGLALQLDGPDASDFMVPSLPSTSLSDGTSLILNVDFDPSVPGVKTAELRIITNDPDENPFTILLKGAALSFQQDTDSDGLNDAAEFQMAALGFVWDVSQPELVETYYRHANSAELYTPDQVRTMQIDSPLIRRDPLDGAFTLSIGLRRSTSLLPGSFEPFPVEAGQITIDGAGRVQVRFLPEGDTAFFRVEAR